MLAVVCPGQGSQSPGMLSPWLEVPGVAERLAAFSEAAGIDLATHGTTSDAETIKDTAIAQPLLVATAILAAENLLDGTAAADAIDVTAGHSVGELSAAAVAGVLTGESAVRLVTHRAKAMATAAAAAPSGMAAVLGGEPEAVLAAIEAAGLWPANVNGAGQVVAAGSPEGIEKLTANPPERARVRPLQVAGAFHTPFMEPARDEFAAVLDGWKSADPTVTLLSNADGRSYGQISGEGDGAGADVLQRLGAQVVAPVRWDLCQETLVTLGVTGLIELAPGGVLTGLARRAMRGVETVAVKTPEDLDAALELASRHHGTTPTETEETTA
ncbi:[acyl-carrier-protein] S-malonyltransferase [Paraoerskovia marina]|uniref:[acyl-carrier-protein] S-malonyltransferase n=1 Tax=Paraoerskovia marina TaxID=545619 RepID=A0A1H1RZY9_9CELL|nr:ACP S-malonyltransferase [Paraoerskovia marina]SDS41310.1 [acyl-carrier-protein] S-malonyltransferase [Paraoerskovia marina]